MIGWMSTAECLFSAALIGDSMITGAKGFLNLFLNMADNVVSAVIFSSPIVEKGTSGWGYVCGNEEEPIGKSCHFP
jgi:hypothetical protein